MDLGEKFHIIKNKRVVGLATTRPHLKAFFAKEIIEEGLSDFHITVKSGMSENGKNRDTF